MQMIEIKTPAFILKGKSGTFHMIAVSPRPFLHECLIIVSGFELNQIIGHQAKYCSEFENTTMS